MLVSSDSQGQSCALEPHMGFRMAYSYIVYMYVFRAPAVCGRAVVSSLKTCLCYMPFAPSPPSPSGRCGKYILYVGW